jgi:hypothetical protein
MDTLTLEVALPSDLFAMLGYSKPRAAEAVREFSVLGLYQERRISTGKAAELLGIGKREFARLLARKGIVYPLNNSGGELCGIPHLVKEVIIDQPCRVW